MGKLINTGAIFKAEVITSDAEIGIVDSNLSPKNTDKSGVKLEDHIDHFSLMPLTGIYRRLLLLLPSSFVDDFGEDIIFVFDKQWRDAYKTNGWRGATGVVIREALGLFTSFCAEWAAESRERLAAALNDGFRMSKRLADSVGNVVSTGVLFGVSLGGVSLVISFGGSLSDLGVVLGVSLGGLLAFSAFLRRFISHSYKIEEPEEIKENN